MSSTYLFENQHIPTRAFSLQINWNLQLRHEPPVASACPLGTANMGSQVTILATLPRSDKIQMKSRRVSCWPKPAFTAPTATVLLQRKQRVQGRHPGTRRSRRGRAASIGAARGQDELSLTRVHLRAGACSDNRLPGKWRLGCTVSVTS